MSREEEVRKTAKFVRDWAIQKAKAEGRSVTEILREMKEELEERRMEREKNSLRQAPLESDQK
jgi:hypothetical protein